MEINNYSFFFFFSQKNLVLINSLLRINIFDLLITLVRILYSFLLIFIVFLRRYQEYKNSKPNKLQPERELWLRSSSMKFQELQVPEFTSMSKSAFTSPQQQRMQLASSKSSQYLPEKSIFQKNVERNIFMKPEKQDYIFF